VELDDRAADAWESLLAIADLAGDDWPDRARNAAVALSAGSETGDDSINVQLLADIRRVFDERSVDRIATADLLAALADDEEAPWGTWGRQDKGLTGPGLAALLRRFKIRPDKWRDEETVRGYQAQAFADAWERYLPGQSRHTRHNGSTM